MCFYLYSNSSSQKISFAPSSSIAQQNRDANLWWQQLSAIGDKTGDANVGHEESLTQNKGILRSSVLGDPNVLEHALTTTPDSVQAVAEAGDMSHIILKLEREVQSEVDAKMRLASTSDVYDKLSEDIKSKSAILAALKSTLRPSGDTLVRLIIL